MALFFLYLVETIRPLNVFLGLSPGSNGIIVSPKAFSSPTTTLDMSCPSRIWRRVKLNFTYFVSNYVMIAFMVAVVVALMHPVMLLILTIVHGLWWMHGFLIRHEVVLFGTSVQNLMTVQQRFYVLFIITSFVIVFECLVPFVIFVGISMLIILTHSLLRDASQLENLSSDEYNSQTGVDETETNNLIEKQGFPA
jgi:PRA1 family protein